jgi:SAM-dependent methyltransferase
MNRSRLAALWTLYVDLPLTDMPCPLCGGRAGRVLLRRDRHLLAIEVRECADCGFVHASRNFDAEAARRFYAVIYPNVMYRISRSDPAYDRWKVDQAAFRWDRIEALIGVPAEVFELGCGDGHFLVEARRRGAGRLAGVEPDPDSRRHVAASLGRPDAVHADLADAGSVPARSGLIALFHVLEHLVDPLETLRALTRDFAGWLVIEVPDLLGDWSGLGLMNFHVAHRSYFTPRTLRAMLATVGFAVVHEDREGPEVGIHPGNLRVFARRDDGVAGVDHGLRPVADPVAEQIARFVRPWSLRHGYPRAAIRLARLALG